LPKRSFFVLRHKERYARPKRKKHCLPRPDVRKINTAAGRPDLHGRLRHDRIIDPCSSRGRSTANPSFSTSSFSHELLTSRGLGPEPCGTATRHHGQSRGSHEWPSAVRRAIRCRRARLFYLPKYSPYLNPSSSAFSKLNTVVAKPLIEQPRLSRCYRPVLQAVYRPNAPITFANADMTKPKPIPL